MTATADAFADDAPPEETWPKAGDDALEAPPPLPDDITVPLDLLDEGGDDNVRTSAGKVEIEALMASIMHTHQRPLQPLVVARLGARFKVGAGNRRLRALKLANRKGFIPKDHPVPVRFAALDELHEISLTENVMRVALHPVDEFEAFRDLLDDGLTVAQIADRFGLKEKAVRQRLALGGLAPDVRKAWRDGKIGQEQAEGFTLCEDHEIQRQALAIGLKSKGRWDDHGVRQALIAGRALTSSGSFAFVGREAYLAAGGVLSEDLFGDTVLVEDPALLKQLVLAKRDRVAAEFVSREGWAFAVWRDAVESPWLWSTLPLDRWMTDEERAALSKGSSTSPPNWKIRNDLMKRVAELPEARALSGVVLDITHRGEILIEQLRLMPSAAAADRTQADDDQEQGFAGAEDDDASPQPHEDAGTTVAATEPDSPGLTKALEEELSEQLADAVAICLVDDPVMALRAAVAALTSSRFGSPLQVAIDGSPQRRAIRDIAFADRFRELGALNHDELLTELARAMSGMLDLRPIRALHDSKMPIGRDALIREIAPQDFRTAIARVFQPEAFFERAAAAVSKQAVQESRGHSVGGRKSDVVGVATRVATETGWLPGPLRTVHYVAPAPATGTAA